MMLSWPSFKVFLQSRTPNLSAQILSESNILIELWAISDGLLESRCILKKYDTVSLADFELNFRAECNKPLVKKDLSSNPIIATAPFSSNENFEARYKGFKGSALPNAITNLDFQITEERYISGMQMIVKGAGSNDTVDLSVVYKALPTDAGSVLKIFGETWNIDDQYQQQEDIEIGFVAKVNAGLYLRFTYTNTGANTALFKANTYLYKKLI